MPTPYIAIAFFGLAALILLWLGRLSHRETPVREESIAVGMTEAEVLAALGPPDEVRRDGDPLDPGYFADGIRASFVYEGRFVVRFVHAIVQEIGQESPLPEVEGEAVLAGRGAPPRGLVGTYFAATPAAGALPVDEIEEVEAIPIEEEFRTPIVTD